MQERLNERYIPYDATKGSQGTLVAMVNGCNGLCPCILSGKREVFLSLIRPDLSAFDNILVILTGGRNDSH